MSKFSALALILAATLVAAGAETPADIVAASARNLVSENPDERLAARDAIQVAGATASRPGAEAERVAYAKACVGFLAPSSPLQARVWLTRDARSLRGRSRSRPGWIAWGFRCGAPRCRPPRAPGQSFTQASDALRTALGSAKDPLAVRGLMDGLALRRDGTAVDAIAKKLGDSNAAVASAAALALGKIGDPKAVAALAAAKSRASDSLRHEIDPTLLDAKATDAKALAPLVDGGDPAIRSGTLARLMQVDPVGARMKVAAAIKDKDADVAAAALRLAIDSQDATLRKSAIDAIPDLAPGLQAIAAFILGEAKATEASPSLKQLVKSNDETVRIAAITALGKAGAAIPWTPFWTAWLMEARTSRPPASVRLPCFAIQPSTPYSSRRPRRDLIPWLWPRSAPPPPAIPMGPRPPWRISPKRLTPVSATPRSTG